MYHLSGISSITAGGRSGSNSLASSLSPPLSPSVLDFSEYVSRQCEKKLQRRVRQLSQKCNKQQATIALLKKQLTATNGRNTTPLTDITNTANSAADAQAEATTDETAALDEDEDEVEGEETTEVGQAVPGEIVEGEVDTAAADDEGDELNDSTLQSEGQQHTDAQSEDDSSGAEIICPPCSPISGRHKRSRTDDSEQCNTEIIDAQWKKAKDDETEQHVRVDSEHHTTIIDSAAVVAASPAAVPAVQPLLPFKPAFLNPFPMSHLHFQGSSAGGALTPYRGLLQSLAAAHQTNSPSAIVQPTL